MKVLIVCPTYARLPFLGRFLSSFTAQTYDDKHLVVINDDKNIEIRCERPDVTVLNCTQRLKIGEKRNLGAVFGTYDIIMPWDDDDIFLPDRIANHVEQFKDPKLMAYRNMASYLTYNNKFTISCGGVCAISYRREEWFRVGGYKWQGGSGEDQELYYKLDNFLIEEVPEQRDFIYNFSGVNYHLSGDPPNSYMERIALKQLQEKNIVGKKFYIHPDFEEYNKYLWLDKIYKEKQEDLPITNLSHGKIDISHLLP